MATTSKYTLSQLQKELLDENNPYVAKTDEQIQTEATNKYKAAYDAKRLAANQSAQKSDLALANQLTGLESSYARQSDEARKNTAQSISSADRYALQRGMQRSSYNASRLANIQNEGDKTLADIQQNLTDAQSNIESQRAQIATQLADTLAQYDTSEQDEISAYIDTLKNTEYERQVSQQQYIDKLKMALYEYGLKTGSGTGGSGSGGSGSSSSSKTSSTQSAASTVGGNVTDSALLAMLDGSSKATPKVNTSAVTAAAVDASRSLGNTANRLLTPSKNVSDYAKSTTKSTASALGSALNQAVALRKEKNASY